MILCLDVGNTEILGGVFEDDKIRLRFRHNTKQSGSSDDIGIFLKNVLRENGIDSPQIKQIVLCSVVPHVDYSLRAACIKYFSIDPFVLQAGVKTGLKIKYHNPLEVGADRIANAIAGVQLFPNQNLIIVDLGTATTFCVVSTKKEYMGGVIMAGMRISMNALQMNAAKLFPVEIIKPEGVVGRSTIEGIQSGLYYGQLGIIREITGRIKKENFSDQSVCVIGTGGFAYLFEKEKLFDVIKPDLVLDGLHIALKLNAK